MGRISRRAGGSVLPAIKGAHSEPNLRFSELPGSAPIDELLLLQRELDTANEALDAVKRLNKKRIGAFQARLDSTQREHSNTRETLFKLQRCVPHVAELVHASEEQATADTATADTEQQNIAACKIQASHRGRASRAELSDQHIAAVKIQATHRGRSQRKKIVRDCEDVETRNRAAQAAKTRLQDFIRGSLNIEMFDDIYPDDKHILSSQIESANEWLDANQLADSDAVHARQHELQEACEPILTRISSKRQLRAYIVGVMGNMISQEHNTIEGCSMPEEDVQAVSDQIQTGNAWVDANQLMDGGAFESKREELEEFCLPIQARMASKMRLHKHLTGSMVGTLSDFKMKTKVPPEHKVTIKNMIREVTEWINANQLSPSEAIDDKLRELEEFCKLFVRRMSSKRRLEIFTESARTLFNSKVKACVSETEQQVVKEKIDSVRAWIPPNRLAETESFDEERKSLLEVVEPIMAAAYSAQRRKCQDFSANIKLNEAELLLAKTRAQTQNEEKDHPVRRLKTKISDMNRSHFQVSLAESLSEVSASATKRGQRRLGARRPAQDRHVQADEHFVTSYDRERTPSNESPQVKLKRLGTWFARWLICTCCVYICITAVVSIRFHETDCLVLQAIDKA